MQVNNRYNARINKYAPQTKVKNLNKGKRKALKQSTNCLRIKLKQGN